MYLNRDLTLEMDHNLHRQQVKNSKLLGRTSESRCLRCVKAESASLVQEELFIPCDSLRLPSTPATLQRLFVHVCVLVVYHVAVLQSSTSAPLILSAYPSLCLFLFTYLSISHQVIVSSVSASNILPPSLLIPVPFTSTCTYIKSSYPEPLFIYIYILIN